MISLIEWAVSAPPEKRAARLILLASLPVNLIAASSVVVWAFLQTQP